MRRAVLGSLAVAVTAALFAFACRSASRSSGSQHEQPGPERAEAWSALEFADKLGLDPRRSESDGVPIRVTDAKTKEPAADALVVTVDEWEFIMRYASEEEPERDAWTQLREIGTAWLTDESGRTNVAASNKRQSVFAFRGDDFGRILLEVFDRAEQTLEISDRSLLVEVVDREGRGVAAAPVALGSCVESLDWLGAWRGTTDADGRVRIPALALERDVHYGCGRRPIVTFDFPTRVYETSQLDPTTLDPVRIVMPECGSLEVELQGPDGRRLEDEAIVELGAYARAEPRGLDRGVESTSVRSSRLPVRDGRLVLPRVEVGLDLELQVESETRRFAWTTAKGPDRAGEVRRIVVRAEPADERSVRLRGTALDAEGRPLRAMKLDASLTSEANGSTERAISRTDDSGAFEFVAPSSVFEQTDLVLHLWRWQDGRNREYGSGPVALVDEANAVAEPVTLAAPPLLVRGTVLDESGMPVFAADVRVKVARFGSNSEWHRAHAPGEEPWSSVSARTDRTGTFEIRSNPLEERHALEARVAHEFDEGPLVPFDVGATDVTIVLPRKSTLDVSLLLDEVGVRARDSEWPWQLYLKSRAAGEHEWSHERTLFNSSGRLQRAELSPGFHDVAIALWDPSSTEEESELLEIRDVRVGGRKFVRDPRLIGIDLRGRLRYCPFEVVDESGKPLSGELRFFSSADPGNALDTYEFTGGKGWFVTRMEASPEAWVCVPRFRPVKAEGFFEHQRIVLQAGIPIRVQLDPATPLPKRPASMRYVGVPEVPRAGAPPDHDAEDALLRTVEIVPGGSATFLVPEAGDWRVLFLESFVGEEGEVDYEVLTALEETIRVEDRDAEQVFVVAPAENPSSDDEE